MTNTQTWWSSGCGRIELQIRMDDAHACSHAGQCDSDVTWLRQQPYIIEQTNALNAPLLADILREYGAWDDGDLANHDANLDRIVWIACCDLAEME